LDKVIILDADMASAFAKIKRLELLKRTFGKGEVGVFFLVCNKPFFKKKALPKKNYILDTMKINGFWRCLR